MTRTIRIGTRGSRLALVQARLVADALAARGNAVELVVLETEGDRRPPDTAWGEGAFVTAIEQALRDGLIDVAVHSAKDVPTGEPADLQIAAYVPRADARDALVLAHGNAPVALAELPAGTRVGTDSPRRSAFLLARRPDLRVRPLHGNVDTRLARLDAGEVDALVLACAGLDRLGFGERIAERLDPLVVPPAPGQGALAVQIRIVDAALAGLVAKLDHAPTRLAVEAEREVLRAAGGGCRAPIGALASADGDDLLILAGSASADGSSMVMETRRVRASRARAAAQALAMVLVRAASRPVSAGADGS